MFQTIHIVFIAVGSSCSVAGWGATETSGSSDKLLWAKVPIRNVTECRVRAFIHFLKVDLHKLTNKTGEEMLTWNNIEKLGFSKTKHTSVMDTLTYRLVDDKMHICAGDNKTDSCWVIIRSFKPSYIDISCLMQIF